MGFPAFLLLLLCTLTFLFSPGLQGVCIGLSEVMASAGKSQLLSFMDDLIPTIRTALCDRFVDYLPCDCFVHSYSLSQYEDILIIFSFPARRRSASLQD